MAEEEKKYKCLDPRGIPEPVEEAPPVARIVTITGKEIHMTAAGEADVQIPARKRPKSEIRWRRWAPKSNKKGKS